METPRKTIALALPGESFSSVWLAGFINLHSHITQRGFNVAPCMGFSNNIYVTRAQMLKSMIETDEKIIPVDYTLFIDNDNTLTGEQFDLLMQDLEGSDLDAVAAWYWVQPEGYGCRAIPACGNFDQERVSPLDLKFLGSVDGAAPEGPDLIRVDYSGFGSLLMRFEPLRMIAETQPFTPYIANTQLSFMGDDTSFWKRCRHAGIRLAVDRRVKVPHYKLRAAEPIAVSVPEVSLVDNV